MRVATIDQVIGGNLARLRAAEHLTIEQAANVLELVTGQSFSVPKLWRWEQGKYRFGLNDLFLMSQFYGVNVLAFLKPSDPDISDIDTGTDIVPVELYVMDYYVDPGGAFITRARTLAERVKEGSRTVQAALDDIENRLADKAGPADLHSTIQQIRHIFDAIRTARDKAILDPTDDNIWDYKYLVKTIELAMSTAKLDIALEKRQQFIDEIIEEYGPKET